MPLFTLVAKDLASPKEKMSTKPKEGKPEFIIKILKLGTLFLEPAEHYYSSNAPNKPDVEMYAGEVSFFVSFKGSIFDSIIQYLCAWCKKLFKTEVGRRNHAPYCRWNPTKIKSKLEISLALLNSD